MLILEGQGLEHGMAGILQTLFLIKNFEGETDEGRWSSCIRQIARKIDEKEIRSSKGYVCQCRGNAAVKPVFKQLNRMKLFNIDLSQFEENADTVNGVSLCHGFVGMMARMRYSNKTEDMKDFCRFFKLAAWNLLRPASFGCSKANLCIPIPLQD